MLKKTFVALTLALSATPVIADWSGRTAIEPTVSSIFLLNHVCGLTRQQGTVQKVTGTFVVPSISIPPGGSSTIKYNTLVWVGIDGTGSAGFPSLYRRASGSRFRKRRRVVRVSVFVDKQSTL